jgi:hypothetical protein
MMGIEIERRSRWNEDCKKWGHSFTVSVDGNPMGTFPTMARAFNYAQRRIRIAGGSRTRIDYFFNETQL